MKSVKLFFFLLAAFMYCGCDSKTGPSAPENQYIPSESSVFVRGKRQLEMQGYKNVTPYQYPAFCCSKNESFMSSEGFKAIDKEGHSVRGCICIGKGFRNSITIRFDE